MKTIFIPLVLLTSSSFLYVNCFSTMLYVAALVHSASGDPALTKKSTDSSYGSAMPSIVAPVRYVMPTFLSKAAVAGLYARS